MNCACTAKLSFWQISQEVEKEVMQTSVFCGVSLGTKTQTAQPTEREGFGAPCNCFKCYMSICQEVSKLLFTKRTFTKVPIRKDQILLLVVSTKTVD